MAEPIFVVKFERGLADRHRLPLAHVLSVLEEVRQMIASVGRDIQKLHGIENPSGDFGLEILAGRDGLVLKKGSIQAQIAITRDVEHGMLAADSVLSAVQKLSRVRQPQAALQLRDPLEHKIVRYLDRIAKIQSVDQTETRFTMKRPAPNGDGQLKPAHPIRTSAVFGASAMRSIKEARLPAFATDKVTLYGRLFELKDRNQERDSTRFWGELRLDNGDVWRVQFDSSRQGEAISLFRKQVRITGRAYYFEAYPPKIIPDEIVADEDRDYEAAFDELYGSEKTTLTGDFDSLLREMHGE
jgi:hypothetical protein